MGKASRFLPAIVLSVLVAAVGVVNGWLLARHTLTHEHMIVLLAGECVLLAAVIWVGVGRFEQRVFRPLARLREQLPILARAEGDHHLDIGEPHLLGNLPDAIEDLGRRLALERRDTARVVGAVLEDVEHRKSRLEAILSNLHEGVVVCNDEHRIVLFNRAAVAALEGAGPIGLHRPLTALFPGDRIGEEYARLKAGRGKDTEVPPVGHFEARTRDGRRIELGMSLVTETDGGCSGYVLSFSAEEAHRRPSRKSEQAIVLADRPEFYDFSLLDSRGDGRDGDRKLWDLDYVVFDTETTGLNPGGGDAMVQIAGVRLVRGARSGEEFDTLVNPGRPIPPASTYFHGITDDMVIDAPRVREVVRSFKAFAQDAVLVAHNAAFDMKFLRMREAESGVKFDNAVLDTLLISFVLQPSFAAHTLEAIAGRFGVSITDDARHTAMGDACATAEIFTKMLSALQGSGLETLGQVMEASNRILHIKRLQARF